MTRRSALFRCDASIDTGSGHVMRCLTLAAYMRERGWDCTFVTAPGTADIVPALTQSGFTILHPGAPVAHADIAVIDNYALSAPDERALRPLADKIVVIDDLADRPHDCDVLIDQTLGREPAAYDAHLPAGVTILTGSAYAMLRPSFLSTRPAALARRREDAAPRRILLSFGGTDPHNITALALDGLRLAMADAPLAADIVVSAASPHLPAITETIRALAAQGADITLHSNVRAMELLMTRADIAVGAGGTTAWERCCLGLPTIIIEIADNQSAVARTLADHGCALNLGWHGDATPTMVADAIAMLRNDRDAYRAMAEKSAMVCDGRGAERIMPYLLPAVDGVRLAPMLAADMRLLYDWQCLAETRRFARNPAAPAWDEHARWFSAALDNPARFLYKIICDGAPAGMLRLDRATDGGDDFEISILVAPEFQGRGVGRAALAAARGLNPVAKFTAEVHPDNRPSRALFESAGFQPINATWYQQHGEMI